MNSVTGLSSFDKEFTKGEVNVPLVTNSLDTNILMVHESKGNPPRPWRTSVAIVNGFGRLCL